MNKIINHKVLHEHDIDLISKSVLTYIKKGWQPFGGIVVIMSHLGAVFYQTMVKYE